MSLPGRRRFLQLLAGSALIGTSGVLLYRNFNPAPLNSHDIAVLSRFLDALIPSDQSPGALELGVLEEILELAGKDADYRWLLHTGIAWLDGESRNLAGAAFPDAGKETILRIMKVAESASPERVERIFFLRVSQDAFDAYYSRPQAWTALAFPGPPQPLGYPNPERPLLVS